MAYEDSEYVSTDTVTLSLDDGTTLECSVVGDVFSAGGREYVALLPMEGPDAEEGRVYLYRYLETENEAEPTLENIMDDEEFELASDAFDEMLDSMEYDELVTEDFEDEE